MNESMGEEKRKMELLAPAGSFEAFKAAVENGADAVYLGGKSFSARASAANFGSEDLKRAVIYAHERQVKVYVTVNILIADSEFPELADYLYELYSLGVDALIVQDIGVAHFIKEVLPDMEIHASTQMTQNNTFGIQQLKKMGFSRVVLARETSAADIEKMARETELDIEVFAHGALCISYSGQCLMSSYIGARSGNRGRCAQPCRLTYQLVDENGKDVLAGKRLGEHLLSPRDLNLAEHLAELQKIGVHSLKIEGRMKRPEYVATVVRIYRKALDQLESNHIFELDAKDQYDLTQIFNRDFTSGYLNGYQGSEMMSYSRPNNRGTKLGRIQEVINTRFMNRLTIKLENTLNLGDGLEIWTSHGREGITVNKMHNASGRSVGSADEGEIVDIDFTGMARVGDRVFKTYDQELMEKAKLSFQEGKERRKRPLRMTLSGTLGDKLSLEVQEGARKITVTSLTEAQEAVNRPLEYEYLFKQLGRLGNTPFFLEELVLNLQEDIIIPVSEINELRRSAIEELLTGYEKPIKIDRTIYQERLNNWQRKLGNTLRHHNHKPRRTQGNKNTNNHILSVAITESKMVEFMIDAGADRIILGGEHWRSRPIIGLSELHKEVNLCHDEGVQLVWRLPRVTNENQTHRIFVELKEVAGWEIRPDIMVANLAEIELLKAVDETWRWETDYFFPVFNQAALKWVLESGGHRAALSTELSNEQLKLLSHPTEMMVFGDMEMMVSEYCAIGSNLVECPGNPREKCGRACHKQDYYLKDRLNYLFPLDTDRECRMHIFNARRLNLITELSKITDLGIKNIRLELHRATLSQAEGTVSIFKELWKDAASGKGMSKEKTDQAMRKLEELYPEGFTKGHFYRGVLH